MFRDLIYEYCNESSIHGMRYLTDKRKTTVERAIWVVFFLISIAACCWFTYNLYTSAQKSSIVVTISNRPMIITEIPFPSITICSSIPFNVSRLNLSEVLSGGLFQDESNAFNRNEMLGLLAQYCNIPDSREKIDEKFNYIQALLKANLRINYLQGCRFGIDHQPCQEDFQEVITNLGVCYTYNSLSSQDLLRSHNGTTFNFSTDLVQIANSSKKIKNILGIYERGRIDVKFKIESDNFENDCQPRTHGLQGLKQVALRSPRDIVVFNNADLQIKEDFATDLSLTPKVLASSENLKSFPLEERECYFENERQLFFMRYYTQENCHFECLTNWTLNRCGCVYYYMPRLRSTAICLGKKLIKCADATQQAYDNMSIGPCRCYSLCNSVKFEVNVAAYKLDMNTFYSEVKRKFTETRIGIFTKEKNIFPLYRSQLYGFNDYVANFGGLLGLFLGVSILSIFELVYYMTIRPLCLWLTNLLQSKNLSHGSKLTEVKPFVNRKYSKPQLQRRLKGFDYENSIVNWSSALYGSSKEYRATSRRTYFNRSSTIYRSFISGIQKNFLLY